MGRFIAGGCTNIQIQQQDFKAENGYFVIPDHLDKHAKIAGLKRADPIIVRDVPRQLLDAQGRPVPQQRPLQAQVHPQPPAPPPLPPLQTAPMPPLPIPQPHPPTPAPGHQPPVTAIPLPIPAPLPATADSTQAAAPPPPRAPEVIEPTLALNPALGDRMLGSDPLLDAHDGQIKPAPAPAAPQGGADPDRL